jgi:hypothetical protein
VRYSFSKTAFEQKVAQLQSQVNDLRALQQSMKDLKSEGLALVDPRSSKVIAPHLLKVREIANEVYDGLSASFKCADQAHKEHLVSLGLEVEYVSDFSLSMAIAYTSECDRFVPRTAKCS